MLVLPAAAARKRQPSALVCVERVLHSCWLLVPLLMAMVVVVLVLLLVVALLLLQLLLLAMPRGRWSRHHRLSRDGVVAGAA
jgi:hypothetical protein